MCVYKIERERERERERRIRAAQVQEEIRKSQLATKLTMGNDWEMTKEMTLENFD